MVEGNTLGQDRPWIPGRGWRTVTRGCGVGHVGGEVGLEGKFLCKGPTSLSATRAPRIPRLPEMGLRGSRGVSTVTRAAFRDTHYCRQMSGGTGVGLRDVALLRSHRWVGASPGCGASEELTQGRALRKAPQELQGPVGGAR